MNATSPTGAAATPCSEAPPPAPLAPAATGEGFATLMMAMLGEPLADAEPPEPSMLEPEAACLDEEAAPDPVSSDAFLAAVVPLLPATVPRLELAHTVSGGRPASGEAVGELGWSVGSVTIANGRLGNTDAPRAEMVVQPQAPDSGEPDGAQRDQPGWLSAPQRQAQHSEAPQLAAILPERAELAPPDEPDEPVRITIASSQPSAPALMRSLEAANLPAPPIGTEESTAVVGHEIGQAPTLALADLRASVQRLEVVPSGQANAPVRWRAIVDSEHTVAPVAAASSAPPSAPARWVASAAEAKFTAAPALPPAGTTAAEQPADMTSATEPKQFAGPAQQNLPELSAVARVPEPARRDVGRSAAEPVRMAGAGAELVVPFAAAFGLDQRTHGLETLTAGAAPVQIAPDAAGELLPAAILRHVTELRQIGASELAVVLQPDAGTQLTLRLSRDAHGEVLVQARCEQGDAQLLAANWGEIRHSLAQQGVRLGALEFSSDRSPDPLHPHAGNGGPSPDGQPSSQRHGQPWPETLDELPLVGSLTESPARRIVLRPPAGRTRLLESWA